MYAVIETGGKQYRVSPGQTVEVELLSETPGEQVTLERVLMISADGQTFVGQPVVAGAQVVGTITREGRGKKIIVFKYKSKKRYRVKTGHRQDYTYLTITDIQAEGKSLVPDDERSRYERLARRAAGRYEQKLAGELVPTEEREALVPVDALAYDEAVGDEEAVARDVAAIEAAGPDEELPADIEASEDEPASAEASADTDTGTETGAAADTDEDQPGPASRRRKPRRS